ncbi:MAG TPA: heme exporter protein CcmD [Burkholderiales bacterium]|nr:heme exporter protein CcmD [Burkholderiales bacterium]
MNWASWSDFFAMGGYAPYVWGSYAVVFGLLVVEIFLLVLRKRSIVRELLRMRNAARRGLQ